MEKSKPDRLLALEGLRGIAAVMVVFMHILLTFYATTLFGHDGSVQHVSFEDNIYHTPLTVFANGSFAVAIFFVLSGFVLSIGFFQTRDTNIIKKLATKRYFRLMIPAFASIMIAWLLVSLHADSALQASRVTGSFWLSNAYNVVPDFQTALWAGTVGIFMNGSSNYNPATWTMYWEFLGSFLVFITCLIMGQSKYRWVVYGILVLLTFQSWLLAFVFGLMLADLYANRQKIFHGHSFGILFLLVGLFLGGFTLVVDPNTLYSNVGLPGFTMDQNRQLAYTFGAMFIIYAVLAIPTLKKVLSWKYIRMLGRYTFSLYLIHMPILFTVCTGVFLWLTYHTGLGYSARALISALIFLVVTVAATWLFERYIDAPAIKLSSVFARNVLVKESKKA